MYRNLIVMVAMIAALAACASTAKQSKVDTPQLLMSKEGNFFLYDYVGRHYVVGSQQSSDEFSATGHLPLTKTILGAGPHGETAVFEVAKMDETQADRLVESYRQTPLLVLSKGDSYTIYKYLDRLYVLGSKESSEKFAATGNLPLTKTILGAGPAGETVVFEVNKNDADMTDRLVKQFKG